MTSSYPYPATEPSYAATPPAGDPTAVMGRRVAAWVVDSVIILAPAVAVLSRDFEYRREATLEREGFTDTDDFCDEFMDRTDGVCVSLGDRAYYADNDDITAGPWLVGLGLSILIYVLIQGLRGWTPGKLLFGIRTVSEDGGAPGIGRAIIRWLLFIVDGLCAGLVGFIVALTSKGHRRVGDMAAKTFVVDNKSMGQPIVVPGMTPGYPAHSGYPGGPGVPGGSGAGWGSPPAPAPGEQPQTWAPPPAWGPSPTWGAPPAEATPPRTRAEESTPHATAQPVEAPSEPGEPSEGTVPSPEPAPAEGVEPVAGSPAEAPPTAEQPRAEEATTAETGTPGYNPQWDPARGTYIVWSPERGHWLGWDDAAKEWKAL